MGSPTRLSHKNDKQTATGPKPTDRLSSDCKQTTTGHIINQKHPTHAPPAYDNLENKSIPTQVHTYAEITGNKVSTAITIMPCLPG